ncbi:MAG: prephenate dehydrogenase [Candidatus Omnitrophica bacterium]|nr:prephenate dehydrogenase [Candidatus Omnitrophota bacterium]
MRKAPLFQQITIVGVGLIGGSLGLAIKKGGLAKVVVGVVRRRQTIDKAFQKKAVDVVTRDLREGVKSADLVILCAPVSVIARQIKAIGAYLKKGALVMDVGSSKSEINKTAGRYLKRFSFVGCHPIAGSEKGGVENARVDLFKGSACFLTERNAMLERFWRALGSRVVIADPKRHDRWAAQSSHLPHLISFALFQDFPRQKPLVVNPSIEDFARLAKSNPELWADILLSNRRYILPALVSFQGNLSRFQTALKKGNRSQILALIRQAHQRSFDAAS